MLETIDIVINFEGDSTIDLTGAIVSQGEVGARTFSITRPTGYEDTNGYTCICKIRNSNMSAYNYTVPADNQLQITDNVFTSGKAFIQFEFQKDSTVIQDNTIFKIDVEQGISHSLSMVDDDTFADFVAHMQDADIHFELPDFTGNGLKFLQLNEDEDAIQWTVISGGAGSAEWGYISGTLSNQTDLQNELNAKANLLHLHTESQVTDLDKYTQAEVDALLSLKADVTALHEHANKALLDTITDTGSGTLFLANDGTYKAITTGATTWGGIIGTLSDQTDLQSELDGKADTIHTHTESDITDLGSYSVVGHTHTESEVTDLDKYTQAEVDSALAGKSDTTHVHTESDITDLDKYSQTEVNSLLSNKVDKTRTINSYALTSDITLDTDDVAEGSTNEYYTEAKVSANVSVALNTNHRGVITGNPHSVSKSDVGLGNVPNTDCTNADNINDGTTKAIITLIQESNFETAYTHSQVTTGNPHSVTKTEVGLGNVSNVDTSISSNVTYDNTTSGLTSTNVKTAIDEIDSSLDKAFVGDNTRTTIYKGAGTIGSIVKSGWYYSVDTANNPVASNGYLHHIQYSDSDDFAIQIFYTSFSTGNYQRRKISGSWGSWEREGGQSITFDEFTVSTDYTSTINILTYFSDFNSTYDNIQLYVNGNKWYQDKHWTESSGTITLSGSNYLMSGDEVELTVYYNSK